MQIVYGALHNAMPVEGPPSAARNHASSLVRLRKGVELSVYGEGGALLIRNQALKVVSAGGREAVEGLPPGTDALSDFCAAIVGGKPLLASAEDGYWAVAAAQAAYESAASGQPRAVRRLTFETS